MIKTITRSLLAVAILGGAANAQAQNIISIKECKQMALEHNQSVKAKRAAYNSSEAELQMSKRASLPTLDFDASYLYQNDPMQMHIPGFELPTMGGEPSGIYSPESTTNLQYHNSYNANVGFSLPLYLGGKLNEARKIAEYANSIAESDLALSQTDVLLNVEQQYWTLVSLIEAEKVNQKSIQFLADVVNDMQNRFEAGVVTKNEVLKAKVELNNAKLNEITITNNIQLSKMAMNQAIGAPIDQPLNPADTTIEIAVNFDYLSFQQEQLDNRQEIAILSRQQEIAESQKTITQSDYLPQIASFANYYFQNPDHLAQEEGEFTWNAGVSLNIPVFHWGERKQKKTIAEMEIDQAAYQLEQTREMLTLEVHQAIFRVKESVTKLEFTEDALAQANENLTLENNRLQEEIATTTDLLNAQMQWQRAQADYISAKADVKINEARYMKAIGELNPE